MLLAQGESYEAFKSAMNELDVSLKCNVIWENDSVAYRCNTCALTPCMSLCASCFQSANHEGHDFTRFFSREGGACDCGNSDVIKPIGYAVLMEIYVVKPGQLAPAYFHCHLFCPRHGENAVRPPSPSPLIVSLPRHIFVKLLVCLFLEWRGFSERYSQERDALGWEEPFNLATFCDSLVNPVMLLINFLQECVNYGGPMREAMAEILMDKELYKALTERNSDDEDLSFTSDMSLDWRTRSKFRADQLSIFSENLQSCFPYLGPAHLECECLLDELLFWVLRMNFPQNLINFALSMLSEPNYTMLSSEALCRRLNEKCDLVHVVLDTACFLLTETLQQTEMTLGMNVNWRIVRGEHRENDNADLVQRSFTLEFEALALTMFNFITAIVQQQHYVAAVAFFDKIAAALSEWLRKIGAWATGEVLTCPKYCVSFHLPLHRHLSTALTHFNDMEMFRKHVEDFRKDEQLLRRIILHPLKIQVARAEYYAGMWVRNGNQLRVQAIIYAQSHINASFQTPDLDLIRYCAANVDPDWFLEALIHNFHLVDVFRFAVLHKPSPADMDVSGTDLAPKTARDVGTFRHLRVHSSSNRGLMIGTIERRTFPWERERPVHGVNAFFYRMIAIFSKSSICVSAAVTRQVEEDPSL
ncbi:unnamed protein product [Nippostrongylus brasiliensis]|uniref:E3 ubiquitin-protein ligase n=1 Tax=Nippostrongylus brasiliensis TaxID=27835 RepID=A0A0N4XF69_NIPBR|nr:unnamed protein product [Nippostrongylus brasiliensis]